MKYVTFTKTNDFNSRLGIIKNDKVIDLNKAYELMLKSTALCSSKVTGRLAQNILPPDLKLLLQNGEIGKEAVEKALDFASKGEDSEFYIEDIEQIKIETPIRACSKSTPFKKLETGGSHLRSHNWK